MFCFCFDFHLQAEKLGSYSVDPDDYVGLNCGAYQYGIGTRSGYLEAQDSSLCTAHQGSDGCSGAHFFNRGDFCRGYHILSIPAQLTDVFVIVAGFAGVDEFMYNS